MSGWTPTPPANVPDPTPLRSPSDLDDGSTITISIDKEPGKMLHANKSALLRCSGFFRRFLAADSSWIKPQDQHVEFKNQDPAVVHLFLKWLQSGKITDSDVSGDLNADHHQPNIQRSTTMRLVDDNDALDGDHNAFRAVDSTDPPLATLAALYDFALLHEIPRLSDAIITHTEAFTYAHRVIPLQLVNAILACNPNGKETPLFVTLAFLTAQFVPAESYSNKDSVPPEFLMTVVAAQQSLLRETSAELPSTRLD